MGYIYVTNKTVPEAVVELVKIPGVPSWDQVIIKYAGCGSHEIMFSWPDPPVNNPNPGQPYQEPI